MKKSFKILSFALALLMLMSTVTLLASCGEKTPGNDTDPTGDTTPAPVVTDAPVTEVLPGSIEKDFDDYTFKILLVSRSTRCPKDLVFEDNGTILDKAVYDRNAKLEETNGVIIEATQQIDSTNYAQNAQAIPQMYISNEALYDYTVCHTYSLVPFVTAGYLYDMESLDSLDLTNPWWDQTINDGVRIADSIYFTSGDISLHINDYMYCVIFNKDLYKEEITDGTDVYKLVEEGKWTLDELSRLCSQVSEDLNADDILDSNDKYGLMTWCDELYASIQAAGERVAKVNEDGYLEFTLQNERVYSIVDKFSTIEQSDWCINFQTMTGGVSWPNVFINGQAMFFMSLFNEVSRFRDMDANYGILPNPKYDENQKDWYCTFSAGLANFCAMPFVQDDAERTGAILDLLGYYSSSTTVPAYYTKTLEGEKIRDEESKFCLDIIFDNKFVDVGHYYTIAKLNTAMYSYVKDQQFGSFASTVQTRLRSAEVEIKKINSDIEKLKEQY